jgi:hypothetical protein
MISLAVQELGDLADMAPHIFAVGETAFRLMRANGEAAPASQSIIVSGESGAGKTVTSRYLLQYFAMVAGVCICVGSIRFSNGWLPWSRACGVGSIRFSNGWLPWSRR